MSTIQDRFRYNTRIIWAITAKDVLEAIKNKNTIAALASVLFLIVMYYFLPVLERGDAPPSLLVYDAGNSALIASLDNSDVVNLYTFDSEAEMKKILANGDIPELGLVLPENMDHLIASEETIEVQGYVLFWVSQEDALALKRTVEQELSNLVGIPVKVAIEGNRVVTLPDSTGVGVLIGLGLTFVLIMTGLILPPHLMLEEKQTHTMEVLLVSPASSQHIVIAKALTGLFYCFVTVGITLVLNRALVGNWGLMILTAICGSLLAIAFGLLLGTVVENRQQLILWAWVVLAPFMFPVLISLMSSALPDWLNEIVRWIPTVSLFNTFRAAFSPTSESIKYTFDLLYIFAWAFGCLLFVGWFVRRNDRM